ncbi:MAG: hypothetical protein JW731_12115 [Bacteroidales bacterium]|nr:hypothetical protein [Bacteroidales bacterium]
MTTFKSNETNIKQSPVNIFNFLSDFNNFKELLPPQVTNWSSDGTTCSFTIQGMADISLKIEGKKEYELIAYAAVDDKPFPLSLTTHIKPDGNNLSMVTIILEAQLNTMLKMMASRPLQNFVNMLVEQLKIVMEK